MIKDKIKSIRINSEIDALIIKSGTSVQKIINAWIKKNIKIETKLGVKK